MTDTKTEQVDIDHVLVIKEPGEEEYSISDSNLTFEIEIGDDGSLAIKSGKIHTAYFIQNSSLEMVKTWRYELHGVVLDSISVDAGENTLSYAFHLEDSGDFLEYTSLEEGQDGPEASE